VPPGAHPLATRDLVLTRIFDAPRALVYATFTDPVHLAKWWGPHGFTNEIAELDVRPGGRIRLRMRGHGASHPMGGVYHEVVPPERVVFTAIAENDDGRPALTAHTTVTFAEESGRTTVTVRVHAEAVSDAGVMMLQGIERGWTESLERFGTEVIAASAVELYITRLFDAPRALVYAAWTTPQHLAQWKGPRGRTATRIEQDLRPGGRWRLCLRGDAEGDELWQHGVYRVVDPPERLVFTFIWENMPGCSDVEMLIELRFTEAGGKTTMELRQTGLPSAGFRDGHQTGWMSSFDRLVEYVAGLARR
jgi:uncharacterized protein YndB with AHSA1/START domain